MATGKIWYGATLAFAPGDQIPAATVTANGWDVDGKAVQVTVDDLGTGPTITEPFVTDAELATALTGYPSRAQLETGLNVVSASGYGVNGVTGTDRLGALNTAAAVVVARGGGTLILPPGTIDISGYFDVPANVDILGPGEDATTIKCTAASSGVRFGAGGGTTTATTTGRASGGFTVDGNSVATQPLLIGLMAQRSFRDIIATNSTDTGIRVDQAQNCYFNRVQSVKNAGWNWVVDYGAGGLTFERCEFTGQGTGTGANLGNLRITATGVNTGGGYSDGPTHIDFFSCQFERAAHASSVANVLIEAGTHIRFYGGNITTSGLTSDKPLVSIRATPGGSSTVSPTHLQFYGVHFAGGSVSGTHYGWALDFDTYGSSGVAMIGCSYANLKAIVRSSVAQTITLVAPRYTASTDAVFVDPAAVLTEPRQITTLDATVGLHLSRAMHLPTRTITATRTLDDTDHTVLADATSSNITVNLPDATVAASRNRQYAIKKVDSSANTVTIDPNGAQTIDGATTKVLNTQWQSVIIANNGTAWYIVNQSSTSSATVLPASPTPEDHGLLAWSHDPGLMGNNQTVIGTAGTMYTTKLWVRQTVSVGSVIVNVNIAGAGLTNVGFALYDSTGALLTSSVNASGATAAAFQGTGNKTVTFTPQSIPAGFFYVGMWFTGTTLPTLTRGGTQSGLINTNMTTPRWGTGATGLTTTAPSPIGTLSNAVQAYAVFAAA